MVNINHYEDIPIPIGICFGFVTMITLNDLKYISFNELLIVRSVA